MKILLYIRPNSDDFLTRLAKAIDANCSITKLCDFRGYGDIWCGSFIYKLYNGPSLYPEELMEDIRVRCRFLRNQNKQFAYQLIAKYSVGIERVFDEYKPDLVLAQIPDNYCMDIIQREALKRNITVINMVGEFIKGYSRITLRGEYIWTREATNEEAEQVVKFLLDKDYVANYAKGLGESHFQHRKMFIRRKLIETFYYPIKKTLDRDKYNYHYNTLNYKGLKLSDVVNKKIDSLFSDFEDISFDDNFVYVPLHVTPEATVDYYGPDASCAKYDDYMLDFIKKSDSSIIFLVKEHPAMFGARDSSLYYRLSELPNVILINPYVNSNLILENVKYVLTFSGSVGVEALIRKKIVFSMINNYYSGLSPNVHVVERISSEMMRLEYEEFDNIIFMKRLLEGLMDAQLGAQASLSSSEIEKMGSIMRNYYDSNPTQEIYKR